ncbi:hypothetical protein MWU65_10275 [Cellulophaga sp. F20128]|uniref:hypothetical protein n=1 Tax=Cellulophaga sp. F20128 TaxID=2926413 RepID=UPI001FF53722|nr:hypothetical protein [Cellulophaga sp. F20128]MCK0157566.1 hypothetical protein [Cellulophaga sp. F20128]
MESLKKLCNRPISVKKYFGDTLFMTILLSVICITVVMSCSKEDSPSVSNEADDNLILSEGQITESDFETYTGEIGIILDARPIAKKGHKPTQVTINVVAEQGNYTQTVPIDEYSFVGQLKLPLENLSDPAKKELTEGVNITAEYKDESGNVIYIEPAFTRSFKSNPEARKANTVNLEETEENRKLTLSENTTYYIQRMKDDGTADNAAWRHLSSVGYSDVITANPTEFNGNEPDRAFTFVPIPGEMNMYAIRHAESLRYIKLGSVAVSTGLYNGSHLGPRFSETTSFSKIQEASDYDNFKFKFEQTDDGSYIIKSVSENLPINQIEGFGLSVSPSVSNAATFPIKIISADTRTWRIVSTNVEWKVTNIGTSFEEPILPPAETGISFSSTLNNCGSGTLKQIVGVEDSDTHTNSVGWEETLSMSTSNTVSVSATVSVGFEAKFFGTGGDYNLSLTAGYEHSWSSTQENSHWKDMTEEKKTTLASKREVIVPAGKATEVYDVYQFYPNTKVNFAQRMRVEGFDAKTNTPLTGNEIKTLFYLNKFNGVITSIEQNSILITLKGTVTLQKIIETESNAQDVPANCK